jgi:hypothetical protein
MEPEPIRPRRESDVLDDFFTPERLAQIDEAEAEIARGEFMSWEDAKIELAKRRTEWLRQNPTAE